MPSRPSQSDHMAPSPLFYIDRRRFLGSAALLGALSVSGPSDARMPAEQALEPDLPIIDCHHHLWSTPFRGLELEGPYLLPEITRDVSAGHNIRATVYVEAHNNHFTNGPIPLRPVGETVFANAVAEQNAHSPQAARRICAGIISHTDMMLGDAVEEVLIAHMEAAPARFRGIRHTVIPRENGGTWEDRERLLLRPAFRAGLARLAKHELLFELMVLHSQLKDVIATVRTLPDVTFVLDHIGVPMGIGAFRGRRDEVFKTWMADLKTLGREPNVHVKVGGMGMITSGLFGSAAAPPQGSSSLATILKPYYEHAIECFTPRRALFESNFPPDSLSADYVTVWNALKIFSNQYGAAERAHMFHDNAVNLYRL